MTKKLIFVSILCVYTAQLNCCNGKRTYELVPAHDTYDLEHGLNRHELFSPDYSSSTESLPDRDETFPSFERPLSPEYYIQKRPMNRSEIALCLTKCAIGSIICAGIGVGSYFLAENLMQEEDKVNDYLIGYNQSLTAITNDINGLYNLTAKILEKLSGL